MNYTMSASSASGSNRQSLENQPAQGVPHIVHSESPDATCGLGRRLGKLLAPNDLIALSGDLGAGKTTLAQGIARGMGIEQPITSPTFIFICEYRVGSTDSTDGFRLLHIDLYRLPESPEPALMEAATFGLDEILDDVEGGHSNCAVIIEWAERLGDALPADHLAILAAHPGADLPASDAESSAQATDPTSASAPTEGSLLDTRTYTFSAHGPRSAALLQTLFDRI